MALLKETLRKESGALAKAKALRSSARKLNLVAASIRGKSAAAALTQLNFEKRRIAVEVKKVLQAAVANAENNHNLDIDKLYVAEAWVGRAFVMKRFHTRGRGRSAGIEKPFSNLTIVVKERDPSTPRGYDATGTDRAVALAKAGNNTKLTAKRARSFTNNKKAKAGEPAEASAKAGA